MKARFALLGAFVVVAALAACGGGGGPTPPVPTATPVNTPTPGKTPTVTPTPGATPTGAATSSVTLGAAQSAPLPSNDAGVSGSIALPAGSGAATLTVSNAPPSPGPGDVPQAAKRRAIGGKIKTSTATGFTGLYVTITPTSGTVMLNGIPGFTITLPSGSDTTQYFVAYYSTTGQAPAWVSASTTGTSPAGASGLVLTIPATSGPTITLAAGQSLYVAVYNGYYIPPINQSGCVGVQGDSVQRQLVGVQPPTAGSGWNYTGSLTDVIVRTSPCPIPTASSAATVTVTVTAAPTTGPLSGTNIDEHSVETDAYALQTTQVTTDATVNGILESSETSTDLSGNQVVTTYGGGGLTYNPPPSQNNYLNAPPATVNTTFEDGTTYARTYTNSGNTSATYSETDTLAGVSTHNTIQTNLDGSATYNVYDGFNNDTVAFTMGAPSGGNIVFSLTEGSNPTQTLTIPAWFGTSGSSLYQDVTVQTAFTGLDSSCPNNANTMGAGSGGTLFTRTITLVDPALGYTDTRVVKSYVVTNYSAGKSVGPVCVVINDAQNLYYDFLFDTPYLVYVSGDGNPIQTDTFNETFYFSSAPVGDSRVRSKAAAAGAVSGNIALQESGFAFARAVQRAQRIEKFERAVQQGQLKGVVR